MVRKIFAGALVLVFVFTASAHTDNTIKVQIPDLPTARDSFGARPGTFHFIPNEDAVAQAKELQRAVDALERLDSIAAGMGAQDRKQMELQLATLRTFATNIQQSRTTSAGESAKMIEQRLNDAKGKYMCGACHGHGMMREMHQRD